MKTNPILSVLFPAVLACGVLLTPHPLHAIAGAADTVIIIGDVTDGIKWSRELQQWQEQIQKTTQLIHQSDELIKLVGDPKAVAGQLIGAVPDLLKPVEDAIGLETRQEALKTATEFYHLNSVAVQTFKDANKVSADYRAFGETVKRDPKRYAHFTLQEAMNARYKKAVDNALAVEKAEQTVQQKALAGLQTATTQAEIGILNGVIAASKGRLELAHAKASQAKGELDAFRGQLAVEDQRKAEADREWAQKVVTEMRQKALDAYNAQFAAAGENPGQ
jgi:hypothetical protein